MNQKEWPILYSNYKCLIYQFTVYAFNQLNNKEIFNR